MRLPINYPKKIKKERYERFMEVQQEVSSQVLASRIGKTVDVIVDSADKEGAIARSSWDAPEVDGNVFIDDGDRVVTGRHGASSTNRCE